MYFGGTLIKEGVLESGVTDARNCHLGANGSTITVSTNGTNKGVFEVNGLYAQGKGGAEYKFVMDGGVVRNTGPDLRLPLDQFSDMLLTADSELVVSADFAFYATETKLDLGGHTLKVTIDIGKAFNVVNGEIKNGLVYVTGGGWFITGVRGMASKEIMATSVDFCVDTPLRLVEPIYVHNYMPIYCGGYHDSDKRICVHGTFKPSAHDYFCGCLMQNGSTIDLSARTNALPVTSSFRTGNNISIFAQDANVTVSMAGRDDVRTFAQKREYIVTWTKATKPRSNVKFVLDAATAGCDYSVIRDAYGLRLVAGGTLVILR
jgi:hypothetical protein